jgi:hypothetical protein
MKSHFYIIMAVENIVIGLLTMLVRMVSYITYLAIQKKLKIGNYLDYLFLFNY